MNVNRYNMNRCNDFNCPNMNTRGYCNITACTNPNKYNYNTNFTQDVIIFPFTVRNRTFYSKKELVDYIWLQEDKDYEMEN